MGPKAKNQKMSLGNFLSDQSYGSWADEMEDMPLPASGGSYEKGRATYGGDRREFGQRSGFGDREYSSDRPQREQLPLPTKPPYTAHLGNLSFEVTQADIEDFFAACEVTSVRIVEDKHEKKPKGFGYVEFATLDGLKKALESNGNQFQGRNIRVSVAEPPKERAETRELNDWTRKGPLPDLPANTRRPSERGGFGKQYDAASDAGSERGLSRRTSAFEQGDGRTRDFGNWERKGPLAPAPAPAPVPTAPAANRVRGGEKSFDRRPSPAWGEGQSQDGSRAPRPPQPERVPTAAELDNQWRAGMRTDVDPHKSPTPTPDVSTPSSPAAPAPIAPVAPAAPAQRPKLNLQKRTVSEVPSEQNTPISDSKSSPFGAARPIDTAAREREIEQKRLVIRQKKEQEDKEREEKRLAEEKVAQAEKAAKGEQVTSPTVRENGSASNPKDGGKENGSSTPTAGRNYEILRRMAEDTDSGDMADTDDGPVDTGENGSIIGDPSVKPAEPTQDIGTPVEAETTAEALEDEGWSTVSKPERKRRNGNQASRAIAS